MALSGYTAPELFTELDRLGVIQDADNIPILYHRRRHCARKAIKLFQEFNNNEELIYSTTLSNKDKNDTSRLARKYWWLQEDAKYIDEIRRRARRKGRLRLLG
jgi:hypothetical protein